MLIPSAVFLSAMLAAVSIEISTSVLRRKYFAHMQNDLLSFKSNRDRVEIRW